HRHETGRNLPRLRLPLHAEQREDDQEYRHPEQRQPGYSRDESACMTWSVALKHEATDHGALSTDYVPQFVSACSMEAASGKRSCGSLARPRCTTFASRGGTSGRLCRRGIGSSCNTSNTRSRKSVGKLCVCLAVSRK